LFGLPGQLETGQRLAALMDELQGGFQTVPVKLPFAPYGRAVAARQAIISIVQQQLDKTPPEVLLQ
jgi:hypothetical protein